MTPKAIFWSQETIVEPTGNPKPSQTSNNEKSKRKPNLDNPWALASEGVQLVVTFGVFVALGFWLDSKKGTGPWGLLGGAAIGLAAGLYNFLIRFLK